MKTVLTGITRNYSNEDGELEVMENLRHDGATLRPIGDPEKIEFYRYYGTDSQTEYTMPEHEKIVFVHQFRGREFVISYRVTETDSNLYLLGELKGNEVAVNKDVNGYGNILSCPDLIKIVQLGIYLYVHTKDKDYTLRMEYEEKLEEIRYKSVDFASVDINMFAHAEASSYSEDFYSSGDTNGLSAKMREARYSGATSYLTKILDNAKKDGYLYNASIIRGAFKLKGGDYILHTAPILLFPKGNEIVRIKEYLTSKNTETYWGDTPSDNVTYYVDFKAQCLIERYKIKVSIPGIFSYLEDIKSEIERFDIFIAEIPNMITDTTYPNAQFYKGDDRYIGFKVGSETQVFNRLVEDTRDRKGGSYPFASYVGGVPTLKERILGVSTGDFKFIKSFSLDELKGGIPDFELPLKDFNNNSINYPDGITPSFNDDNMSRDIVIGNPFLYNNSLHLSNLTQELFRGYNPYSFMLPLNEDNTSEENIKDGFLLEYSIWIKTMGRSVFRKMQSEGLDNPRNLGYMISYPRLGMEDIEVRVIRRVTEDATIATAKDEYRSLVSKMTNFNNLSISCLFGEIGTNSYSFLKTPTGNDDIPETGDAYSEKMNEIQTNIDKIGEITDTDNSWVDKVFYSIEKRENILRVSDVLNPLVFPVEQTYEIGQGEIKELAVIDTALSQGQFGQYPLYVFCSDGVYAMNVGTDTAYTNVAPVSRDVITGDIISIDKAVVFISDRGLKIMQGDKATDVSLVMQSNAYEQLRGEKFEDFIKDAKLAYNYFFGEIYLLREDKDFAFVYELKNQTWGTRKIEFKGKIDVYPDLYIQDKDNVVYKLSREIYPPDGTQKVKLKTRPMKWGDGFKKIARMIIRSLVIGNWNIKILASNDGVNFHELRNVNIDTNTPKRDIPFRRISGSFKYYVLKIEADMDERAYIEFIETELQESIFNKRIR